MDNKQPIDIKREELFNAISGMCREYYEIVHEIFPDQRDSEHHFIPLWRRLTALFNNQRWDRGEFRPISWDEAKNIK